MSQIEVASKRIRDFVDNTLIPLTNYPVVNIVVNDLIDDLKATEVLLKEPTKMNLEEAIKKIEACIFRVQSGSFISHTAAGEKVHSLENYLRTLREFMNRRIGIIIGEAENVIEIIWHGHACFEIRGANVTIVTDPFKGIGLPEPSAKADIVLCSHSHGDHNNVDSVVKPGGSVFEGFLGVENIGNVNITGIASFHDDVGGNKRGKNSVYAFNVDGVRFCHLGDLGNDLTNKEVKAVGEIDVLFVPVGGVYTIDASQALSVSEKLNPKIILPMHYKVPGMSPNFDALSTVEDFIKGRVNVKKMEGPIYTIEMDDEGFYIFPMEMTIVVPSLNIV